MKAPYISFIAAAGLGIGVFTRSTAVGATLVSDYNQFNLSGMYGSWGNPGVTTITSGPTSFTVESSGFGGGFFDIDPQIDATGETRIELHVTIGPGSSLPGVVLALVDGDGTLQNYAWYALVDGDHLLTKTIGDTTFGGEPGSIPGMDLSTLDFFHIQVDGGPAYRVSFNNLELTPEPASCALLAVGLIGVVSGRQRRKTH